MRYCLAVISIFLPLLFATHTQAASRSDRNGCYYRNELATKLLGGQDRRIAACTRIIEGRNETDFERSKAYFFRGGFYRIKGDIDRAVADYSMATDPSGCGSLHNHLRDHDLDRAIAAYTEFIRLNPPSLHPFKCRGDAYREKGELDLAIDDYIKAYRLRWSSNLPEEYFSQESLETFVVSLFYLILAGIVVTWVIFSGMGGAFKIAALIFTALALVTYIIFARCC